MKTLIELNQYFDDLLDTADDDTLFASAYIRGFIEVLAVEYGDVHQVLSADLAQAVTDKLIASKHELSPKDRAIVQAYWQQLIEWFV
jgi:hypothetical protein